MWIIIDGVKITLGCNIIGDVNGSFQLNPRNWGTDVISIQANGSLEKRPQGANGPFETFHLVGDFAVITPVDDASHTSFSFKAL